MKNKFLYITLILTSCTLVSCKSQDKESSLSELKNKINNYSFDNLLKCGDFTYEDGYFVTADYGCIYNPKEHNNLGNILIYYIAKNAIFLNTRKSVKEINKMSIEELKREFNIYVFLIEKNYLNYNKTGDPMYYQNENYVEKLFTNNLNNWKLIDSIKIQSLNENNLEQEWRENFINHKVQKLKTNDSIIENNISQKWYGDYSVWLDYGNIGGQNAGYEIILEITKDSIKATGEGFQISFIDLLTAKEENNKLNLYHSRNLYGYKQGKYMNPEFVLIKDQENYYLKTQWISKDVRTKPKKLGYEIVKNK
jgi:hypothetical protein